tara:strand:+ start:86 stop:466 length:381 start_codon:yes stop_codon:yes gene_type:complete
MNCILCHESNDDVSPNSELCKICFHLLRWFRGYLDVPDPNSITLDTTFVDLGVDSLDYMDWLMEAEEMFDVTITNAEAERINTVGKYLEMLRNRGAVWAANKSIRLKRRGNWCPSYDWDVVTDSEA